MAKLQALTLLILASFLSTSTAQVVDFDVPEVRPDLVAYWEWGSCGRYGNDVNADFLTFGGCPQGEECHCGDRGCVPLTRPNAACAGGQMYLQFYGDDQNVHVEAEALVINCCSHIWFAQYSCTQEPLVILDRNVHYSISPVPQGCHDAGQVKAGKTRMPSVSTTIVETTSLSPSLTPTAPDCSELVIGSEGVVVDGSFEVLRPVAATSANYHLNGNVNGAGWHNGVKTADSLLAPLITTAPFTTHNVPESPDGGVFAGAAAYPDGRYTESFWAEIDGLTAGASYNVNFWQSMTADQWDLGNLGDGRVAPGNQGAWEVHFGDSVQLSPTVTYLGMDHESVWTRATLSFTAASSTERMEFFSKTVNVSASPQDLIYILVDGITVTPNTPECRDPTSAPSAKPSKTPSQQPAAKPSKAPSQQPAAKPSKAPSQQPANPSPEPTASTSNCAELELGSAGVAVDGSFEALRSVASTSANYHLNSNVNGAGWHNGVNTADSLLAPLITTAPFTTHNVPESPNGGVFAGAAALPNSRYTESFWTEIEGLTVGTSYNVNFWQSMTADQIGLGDGRVAPGNQGAWEVHFGDSMQLSPAVTYLGMDHESVWTQATLSFTAARTTEKIEFFARTVNVAASPKDVIYVLVDGITVTPNTPECRDPTMMPTTLFAPSVAPTVISGERYCYPEDPSIYAILADDLQSLEIGGSFANSCDNGCVVTQTSSPSWYSVTDNSATPIAFGSGSFSIEDSTLLWANKVVFTKEACDACVHWIERFEAPNSVCSDYHSVFERSELPASAFWSYSNTYGWYTTLEHEAECRNLCANTTRCESYGYQKGNTVHNGCFLYSEVDCTAVFTPLDYALFDKVFDCGLTTTPQPTTIVTTTTSAGEMDCGSGKVNWRFKDNKFRYHTEGISGLGAQFEWDLPRACGWLCSEDVRCKAWSFDTSGNQCSLSEDSEIIHDARYEARQPGRITSGNCIPESKPECPQGNSLNFLGQGRCAADGAMLDWPASGKLLGTSKDDCLSQCEANDDCIGAITAYDYYCAHYMSSDVAMIDQTPSTLPQWECHAKCFYTKHENECNEFMPNYRLPGASIFGTQRVAGNPVDGWYLPGYCARLCELNPVCKAWAFDTSGNTCTFGNTAEIISCAEYNNCGPNEGRMTAGSCGGDEETPSVCPRGFIPHGENGELNLINHPTGSWPMKDTIEECAAFCETVDCVAFEYAAYGRCATHTVADLDMRPNPVGWTACLLETDEPTPAPTRSSDSPVCPDGFHQVGDLSTNNDIGGWGMATRDEVYTYRTFEDCHDQCENAVGCLAFNWNQAGMCVWYDSNEPNRDDGRGFMFCARGSTTTEIPTMAPTTSTTTKTPTKSPTEIVQIPYDGPEYFCDSYQDPHVDTWHLAGGHWQDYRIDLATGDELLHRGDWLMFEYGSYQVIMSHHENNLWNSHIYIRKSGSIIYSYSGQTAQREINHAEVEVQTNPASLWTSNVNYRGYGNRYEYELIILRNIPLEIVWLQEKAYRDVNTHQGQAAHGAILDIALKWNEDWRITSGVCSSTKATYAQFKLGDNVMTGRRELVQSEESTRTCPTSNQCCGRLAGLVNQFESCLQDNYQSCCVADGADPSTCCGSWVQEAPRCTTDSCSAGESCNLIDGYCYPEAEVAAITAYKGSCHSNIDFNLDLDLCSMDSGSLSCEQIVQTDECDLGIAYLSKTIGGSVDHTTFYDSCEFEWYAEYSCEAPVQACPVGYLQVGEFGANIPGCGLEGCLDITTIEECKERCEAHNDCFAFSFARPQEESIDKFSCTLYDNVVPTATQGKKIFCKNIDAPTVGSVTFQPKFDFVNAECDAFLKTLEQVVARTSRTELRLVEAKVQDCKSGAFDVKIYVESLAQIDSLRKTVEDDLFLQRLNNELKNHGKSDASSVNNVATTEDGAKSVSINIFIIVVALVLVIGVALGFYCNQSASKKSDDFDPEFGEKRQPELRPEISLKSLHVPDGESVGSTDAVKPTLLDGMSTGMDSEAMENTWNGDK